MRSAPMPTAAAAPQPAIALVDDDRNILASVSMALEEAGFAARCYSDPEEAVIGLQQNPPDLVVLDVKMPKLDGFQVLERLRRTSALPVIFLTSKEGEDDELRGLALGADDYIRKPFSQALLTARIRALLRRRDVGVDSPSQILTRGPLVLDQARHVCAWKGQSVDLTVTEFLILKALAVRPGHVKSRDQLLDAAYGETGFVDDRTIDSHIKRLRKKFRLVDGDFSGIETLYGVGYRYSAA